MGDSQASNASEIARPKRALGRASEKPKRSLGPSKKRQRGDTIGGLPCLPGRVRRPTAHRWHDRPAPIAPGIASGLNATRKAAHEAWLLADSHAEIVPVSAVTQSCSSMTEAQDPAKWQAATCPGPIVLSSGIFALQEPLRAGSGRLGDRPSRRLIDGTRRLPALEQGRLAGCGLLRRHSGHQGSVYGWRGVRTELRSGRSPRRAEIHHHMREQSRRTTLRSWETNR